jgi:hypothetical protein
MSPRLCRDNATELPPGANAPGVSQSSVSTRVKTLGEDLGILSSIAVLAASGSPRPDAFFSAPQ